MSDLKDNSSQDGLSSRWDDAFEGLSPEEAAALRQRNDQWDISPYFVKLFWEEPFFARIYAYVSRFQDRKHVPTAGVAIVQERPTLLWNPDFFVKLKYTEVLGVLKHEAYHLIYNHITARRRDPHMIWNWATDLSINTALQPNELPGPCFVPGKPFVRPSQKTWDKMKDEERDRFEKLSALIAGFPPEKSADWYFERLMQNEAVKEVVKEQEEAKARAKEWASALAKAIKEASTGADGHDSWGQNINEDGSSSPLPDGVRQLLEGELKEMLRDAVNSSDGGNRWGSVPASMQRNLRALISSEVDWRQVLRSFVGLSRRADNRSSWKRVNKKLPYMYPGRSRNYTANIAVFVDQSGSVDDRSLELAYGELRSMARRTTFTFFPFDFTVDTENSFVWKKGQTQAHLSRFRCGGTSFQACVDYVNQRRGEFDGMIIISDGECDKPTPTRVRLAYLIVPGRRLHFDARPDEIVIQMKGDAKDD